MPCINGDDPNMLRMKYISRISWRIILIHLAATLLFIFSAKQFVNLHDLQLIELLNKYGIEGAMKRGTFSGEFMSAFLTWRWCASLIGLFLGFILSMILVIRSNKFWLNSVLVFIAGFLFIRLGLVNMSIIHKAISFPGSLVVRFGLPYKFILNGVLLACAGLFLFLSKWMRNFAFQIPNAYKKI